MSTAAAHMSNVQALATSLVDASDPGLNYEFAQKFGMSPQDFLVLEDGQKALKIFTLDQTAVYVVAVQSASSGKVDWFWLREDSEAAFNAAKLEFAGDAEEKITHCSVDLPLAINSIEHLTEIVDAAISDGDYTVIEEKSNKSPELTAADNAVEAFLADVQMTQDGHEHTLHYLVLASSAEVAERVLHGALEKEYEEGEVNADGTIFFSEKDVSLGVTGVQKIPMNACDEMSRSGMRLLVQDGYEHSCVAAETTSPEAALKFFAVEVAMCQGDLDHNFVWLAAALSESDACEAVHAELECEYSNPSIGQYGSIAFEDEGIEFSVRSANEISAETYHSMVQASMSSVVHQSVKHSLEPIDVKESAQRELQQALQKATECGLLDDLAGSIHPDIINQFCDAVDGLNESDKVRGESLSPDM